MNDEKNNKVLPTNTLSEVQKNIFGFDVSEPEIEKDRKIKKCIKPSYIQSKLDVGDYKDPVLKISDEYTNEFFMDEKGTVSLVKPICPNCKSHKVIEWGLYSKNVLSEVYSGDIKLQRYRCKKCNKTFITDLGEHFDFHSHIANSLKEKASEIKELNWSSLRDIAEYYKIFYEIDISYETVRKSLIIIEGNEIDYELPQLSGYYGYDAQWIKINKKWHYRHVFYDLVHKMPVAELFTEEEENDDIYYLIDKYTKPINRIAIVTDTKPGYDTIMRKLKFERHQYCVFHLKHNLNKIIRTETNKKRQEIKAEVKKRYENKSDTFIDEKVEEELKPFKNDNRYALQLFYYVFKEESFDKALSYVELIKANIDTFPEFIKKYVEDVFLDHYKSYLYYLEEPHKGKLDYTNNKTEGYFRATMPKGHKRNYRTFEGIINQIYHRAKGLIKNQIEKKKKEKPKRFVR